MSDVETQFERAEELAGSNPAAAVAEYRKVIEAAVDADDVDAIRFKEQAILKTADIFRRKKQATDLVDLLMSIRGFFGVLPKAKTAKIVRQLFDQLQLSGATPAAQTDACEKMVEWSRQEKQTFLRHRLQHRLGQVYHAQHDAVKALAVINPLLREVRRLEDKALLVDVHLLESKVYYGIKNRTKARASLVAARTNANAIYCPPLQQAEIDMQSGILHADEKEHKTAFSYLYEAFEGFHGLGDQAVAARRSLRYMIVSKILSDNTGDELRAVLASKTVLEYTGDDVDVLHALAKAYKAKDTHEFNAVGNKYKGSLEGDEYLTRHLSAMEDQLTEAHLLKVIEPYNRVQITFLSDTLRLPADAIEARLSQMILDKKLRGIVDQQHACLVVFEEEHPVTIYADALTTLDALDKLVNSLFDKVNGKFDALVEENKKADEEKKKKEDEKKAKRDERLGKK